MAKSKAIKPAKKKPKGARTAQPGGINWVLIGGLFGLLVIVFAGVALLTNQKPGNAVASLPPEISIDQAFDKYQAGTFFLDVRTQEEWDEYHAPNTTLIPLDQLASRVDELPRDQEIVVVCRSGNRSSTGRDILKDAGFTQVTSMAGGLSSWRSAGFPVEP